MVKVKVYCPYCRKIKETTTVTPFVAKIKCSNCGNMLERELVFVALKKLEKKIA